MDFEFLREIRVQELERIARDLPAGAKILEIGSGAGWQAKQLASYGHEVEGIDVVGNYINYDYRHVRVWDVKIYDGQHIPFPEKTFDIRSEERRVGKSVGHGGRRRGKNEKI